MRRSEGEGVEASSVVLVLDGWAGRRIVPVRVLGHTARRVRVQLLADTVLPSRRRGQAGDVILVPPAALRVGREGAWRRWPADVSQTEAHGDDA
jgi:hypothetical protein